MTIISMFLVASFFVAGFIGLMAYSGHDPPFSVIVSQSMQKDQNKSQIGSLDTGDMVLVRNKNRVEIRTYLEGYFTGFKTFGDYGSVIIYNTSGNEKIIHRVLMKIEIDLDEEKKFARIPDLKNYPSVYLNEDDDKEKIMMDFHIEKENSDKKILIPIEKILKEMKIGTEGYITMGDGSDVVDQNNQHNNKLVEYRNVDSVPVFEIPWLGSVKMIINGNGESVKKFAPNSILNLGVFTFTLIVSIFSSFALSTLHYVKRK